jgi:hypothetical protein
MMNGYKNFADDVRLAFAEYLKQGRFKVKSESWFKDEFCYSVILESVSQYLNFYVDSGNLGVYIIDKSTLEFMDMDDLILFLNPGIDLKGEKSRYFQHNYYEDFKSVGKSTAEQASVTVKHLCLGELNAYSKLIGKYLNETIFTDSQNWTEKIKLTGKILHISRADGIT